MLCTLEVLAESILPVILVSFVIIVLEGTGDLSAGG